MAGQTEVVEAREADDVAAADPRRATMHLLVGPQEWIFKSRRLEPREPLLERHALGAAADEAGRQRLAAVEVVGAGVAERSPGGGALRTEVGDAREPRQATARIARTAHAVSLRTLSTLILGCGAAIPKRTLLAA